MWLLHGRGHSFEADWWSSGVLLHTLLTGQTPFEAESLQELFQLLRDPELAVVLPVPDEEDEEEEDEEEEGGGGDGAARAAHPQRGGARPRRAAARGRRGGAPRQQRHPAPRLLRIHRLGC